jgi:hypothetical protein
LLRDKEVYCGFSHNCSELQHRNWCICRFSMIYVIILIVQELLHMQSYGYKVIALRKRDGFATLFLVACLKDVGDFVLRISCLCSVPSVTDTFRQSL